MNTTTGPERVRLEGRGAPAVQLLAVDLAGGRDSLMRVLNVLHRRGCDITNIDFASPDRHHPGRLVIGFSAPSPRAHCVGHWLENLVDVHAVELLRAG